MRKGTRTLNVNVFVSPYRKVTIEKKSPAERAVPHEQAEKCGTCQIAARFSPRLK